MTIAYLTAHPYAWLLVAGLLGLIVGSFLNVVIHRLPIMLERDWKSQCEELLNGVAPPPPSAADRFDLIAPRSRCPSCATPISAFDNIPVLSYLLLRGRCRHCGAGISVRYPLVECLSGILCVIVAWRFGVTIASVAGFAFTWSLIALAFIDYDHQYLPDNITLPFLWLGLLVNTTATFTPLRTAVIGAAAGYLSLWIVYQGFRLLTGKEGMGYGDFKLLAMIGAFAGWTVLPATILLSSLFGAIIGIALIAIAGRERGKPIPFGPFLAIAGWTALLFGDALNRWYLDFSAV